MKLFLSEYGINWPNFIYRLWLLPKLLNRMYFLFYDSALDDVMKFEDLKFKNLIFLRTKTAFEVRKWKLKKKNNFVLIFSNLRKIVMTTCKLTEANKKFSAQICHRHYPKDFIVFIEILRLFFSRNICSLNKMMTKTSTWNHGTIIRTV